MLVLTRKQGEKLIFTIPGIEAPAEILVVRATDGSVRLGMSFDPRIQILRDDAKSQIRKKEAA